MSNQKNLIEIQASVSKGWLYDEFGYTFDKQYYFDPLYRWKQDRGIDEFVKKRFPDYPIYNMESNLVQAEYFDNKQILVGGIQPNLILGACLGAEFVFFKDKDSDIVGKPIANIKTIDELPTPEAIIESSFIKMLDSQIIDLQEKRPDLRVIPPFFWDESGRATIHGFITTSYKIFGENIFIKMFDDPAFVIELHSWIADVYTALIKHFSELANLPITIVHIGECSGSMLSTEQFHDYVVPFASKMGEILGPLRMHTCGYSDHLLEEFKNINNLKIIDTGSNTSIAMIRDIFGNSIEINIAPPFVILFTEKSIDDVVAWLDRVITDNNNGHLKFAYHLESSYSIENCLKMHDELFDRGLIEKGRIY